MKNEGTRNLELLQCVEETLKECRFPRARFSREEHKSLARLDGEEKLRKRSLVGWSGVKEPQVRRGAEGVLSQSEKRKDPVVRSHIRHTALLTWAVSGLGWARMVLPRERQDHAEVSLGRCD